MTRPLFTVLAILSTLAVSAGITIRAPHDGSLAGSTAEKVETPFCHSDHVQSQWYLDEVREVERDCRGCHRFTASEHSDTETPRDPQQVCTNCHYDSGFEVRGPANLDALRLRSTFLHVDHQNFECRECHLPEKDAKGLQPVPMPIRRGIAECARCHGSSVGPVDIKKSRRLGEKAIDEASRTEGFVQSLNQNPGMGPQALGPFLHADHVAKPKALFGLGDLLSKNAGTCSDCHAGVLAAPGAQIGNRRFEMAGCDRCHIAGENPPRSVRFATSQRSGPSLSALTFGHQDHFDLKRKQGVCTVGARQEIEELGCAACHEYEAKHSAMGPDFRYMSGGSAAQPGREAHLPHQYEGCVRCHDLPTWKAGAHEDWDECIQCHRFGAGARTNQMLGNRQSEVVRRIENAIYRFAVQLHPYIGEDGEDPAAVREDCKECHKSPVGELPSRLVERSFRHQTHLPKDFTTIPPEQACGECHAEVALAGTPQELGTLVEKLGARLLFDGRPDSPDPPRPGLKVCSKCHVGGVEWVERRQPVPRAVPHFSHQDHLSANRRLDGKVPSCVDCHSLMASGDDFSTLPDALDCTKCHNHKEAGAKPFAKHTSELREFQIQSCRRCHSEELPEPKENGSISFLELGNVDLAQTHPLHRRCDDCHLLNDRDPAFHERKPVSAQLERDDSFQKQVIHRDGFPKKNCCLDCHWQHKREGMTEDPTSVSIRHRDGSWVDDYPPGMKR